MKWLSGLFLLSAACAAQQLPDAPKPLALNVGTAERYNFTKSKYEISPSVTLDYRFNATIRVGVSYSHDLYEDNNTVTGFVNVKVLQWGTWKLRSGK